MQKPINLVISILSIALLVACGGGGNPPSKREAELEKELQALKQEKEGKLSALKESFKATASLHNDTTFMNFIDSIVKGANHEVLIDVQKDFLGCKEPEELLKELELKPPAGLTSMERSVLEFLRFTSPLVEILKKEYNKQEELANLRKKHR